MICFCLSKVVEKAIKEQEEVVAEYGEELTIESLNSMVYLHAILQETMRLDPVLVALLRRCVRTFELEGYRYCRYSYLIADIRNFMLVLSFILTAFGKQRTPH